VLAGNGRSEESTLSRDPDRFTGTTQAWFDEGDGLAARAEAGDLPPELGGEYSRSLRTLRLGIALAIGASCAGATLAWVLLS
jgi:hypothetical protein